MTVKFDVKMTRAGLFEFLIYHTYSKSTGILGLVIGIVNLILGFRQVFRGAFSDSLLFFLFAVFFLGVSPLMIWFGTGRQMRDNPAFHIATPYELAEDGLTVTQGGEASFIPWENFKRAFATKRVVVLYLNKNRALIIPMECLGEQKEEIMDMFGAHVAALQGPQRKKAEKN